MCVKLKNFSSADKIGITEEFISNLVEAFYTQVHEHKVLGPVFKKEVSGDWESHLAKMKTFWSSIVLGSGKYSGKPMQVHQRIEGITPEHFKLWLDLFKQTLENLKTSPEITQHFMLRAEQIAVSLQAGIFKAE